MCERFGRLVWPFVWKGKMANVSRQRCRTPLASDGLPVVDFRVKCVVSLAFWIILVPRNGTISLATLSAIACRDLTRVLLSHLTQGVFTLQKNLGPDPSKKWYGPITSKKKYWSFCRAIGAYGPVETPVLLYKSCGSVPLF